MTAPTRAALRRATHERHEALHAYGPFRALMEQRLTREDYRRLLLRLHGFHRPLEEGLLAPAAVAELRCFGIDPARLPRVDRLRRDLMALGETPEAIESAPRMASPTVPAPGWAMGWLYVRQGSMLGGRVMARRLDGLLGNSASGRLFLTGSDDDPELWRDCCRALEACGTDPGRRAAMTAAAQDAFDRFADWFQGLAPSPLS